MIGITRWLCSVAQLFQTTCSSWEMLVCLFFSQYTLQKNLFIFYTKFLLTTSTCRELALSLSCLCTILLLITLYCSSISCLSTGTINCSSEGKFSLPSVFVNIVLLEDSHINTFMYFQGYFCAIYRTNLSTQVKDRLEQS